MQNNLFEFFSKHINEGKNSDQIARKTNNVYNMLWIKELTMNRIHEYIMRQRKRKNKGE